jgi:hypothetical protein
MQFWCALLGWLSVCSATTPDAGELGDECLRSISQLLLPFLLVGLAAVTTAVFTNYVYAQGYNDAAAVCASYGNYTQYGYWYDCGSGIWHTAPLRSTYAVASSNSMSMLRSGIFGSAIVLAFSTRRLLLGYVESVAVSLRTMRRRLKAAWRALRGKDSHFDANAPCYLPASVVAAQAAASCQSALTQPEEFCIADDGPCIVPGEDVMLPDTDDESLPDLIEETVAVSPEIFTFGKSAYKVQQEFEARCLQANKAMLDEARAKTILAKGDGKGSTRFLQGADVVPQQHCTIFDDMVPEMRDYGHDDEGDFSDSGDSTSEYVRSLPDSDESDAEWLHRRFFVEPM